MDVSGIAANLTPGTLQTSISISLINSVNSLQQNEVDRLFASLGLGQNINAVA